MLFRQLGKIRTEVPGYNPGMVEWRGRVLFAYRHDSVPPDKVEVDPLSHKPVIRIGYLGEDLTVSGEKEILRYAEDPRLFVFKDRVHVAYTNSPKAGDGLLKNYMRYCELDDDLNVRRQYRIEYGEPAEKNWQFFSHGNSLHCVYDIRSQTVLQLNPPATDCEVSQCDQRIEWPWHAEVPHGGNPPVRVGDEYFAFFHHWVRKTRYREFNLGYLKKFYFVHAYAFRAHPPFPITRRTRLPLIVPHAQDRLIFMPTGAILKDGIWYLAYGVNDDACEVTVYPHQELLARMEFVEERR